MRVVSYNIRHGRGIAGLISLKRTARVISALEPDVVAVNEIYRWTPRHDQVTTLAHSTGLSAVFHGNVRFGPTSYGNALLSRGHVHIRECIRLPKGLERRGCMLAEMELGTQTVCIAVTHLGLDRDVRAAQIRVLAKRLPREMPLVLAGDTNCELGELDPLLDFLSPTLAEKPTFPSWMPFRTVDHILFSEHWTLQGSGVVRSLASDHLPVYADLELPGSEPDAPATLDDIDL